MSGYGISKLLKRAGADDLQADAAWLIWVFSIFVTTNCFHHYSYTVLPYQITILCSLCLRHRWLSFLLGICIGLTGEEHLLAAPVLIGLAAMCDQDRSRLQRLIDAAVPIGSIGSTLVLHRLLWIWILQRSAPIDPRFTFHFDSFGAFGRLTWIWLSSLYPGAIVQVDSVTNYSGVWFSIGFAVAFAAFATRMSRPGGSTKVVLGVACICCCSFVVLWLLSTLTGQTPPALQRRYAHVPYTLCTMTVAVALLAPGVRRIFGLAPAATVVAFSFGLWWQLQYFVLPVIRAQDDQLWERISKLTSAKAPAANILFVSASYPDVLKEPITNTDAAPMRPGSPEIFELAFGGFWWELQYAIDVVGATFAAYRWEEVDASHVRLFGSDVNGLPPRIVEKSSIVTVFDEGKPGLSLGDPREVSTYGDFQTFIEAAKHKGMPIP